MYRSCLFLFVVFNSVICQDCVTEDFENGIDHFTTSGVCQDFLPWKIEEYSSIDVEGPNPKSTSFILAEPGMKCISSHKFTMTAGGALEVNVYYQQVSIFDQLTVRVFKSIVGEDDILIGTSAYISNSVPAWDTIRININGYGSFEGYITFQAFAILPNPIIWIDSFRYIGPSLDKDSCLIYDEEMTTDRYTTITSETSDDITTNTGLNTTSFIIEVSTTIAASTSTTPEEPVEDCLIEDFEHSFDDNFTNNYGICIGFSAWDIEQYSFVNISNPHPRSASFIAPRFGSSCVASYKFKISAGGAIQVNVYMVPTSPVDQLTVTAFQSVLEGHDVPISRMFLNAMSPGFLNGWQILNVTINGGPDTFEGYVTFQALTFSTNPFIWIDSFRYIGPSMSMDSCLIYDDKSTTTQTPITPTPEISTTTTTGASYTTTPEKSTTTTSEASTTISSEAPTTTTTEAPNEDCLTEDFENNFEDNFTNDHGACVGFSVWDIQQYLSVNISSPHPESTSFIMPSFGSSCVASNKFNISAGSKIQVNVYMMITSPVDQLTVTVFQSISEGDDIPIGRVFLNAMSPGFVNGWQTLNMNIDETSRFLGYLTFQALTLSSYPIIWIDSYRYIGPSMSMDSCLIYEDESTTTQTPITSTPEISTTTTSGALNTTTPKQSTTIASEASTTISSEAPSTTTTKAPNEDCLTEDFENNFEDNFTNGHGACVGFSVWDIQQYLSVNISSPHPKSTSFIMPSFGSSCVASNKFNISAGSKLQVIVYMIPTSPVDQLTVTIFQSFAEGGDIPIGRVFLNAMSPGFVNGWQTLNLNLDEPDRFLGYLTFQALTLSSYPNIWIDSYRYIGPSMSMDSCLIYKDVPTTTQTPIISTPGISTTSTTKASTTIFPEQSTITTTETSTTNTPEQLTTTTPEASTTITSEQLTTTTLEASTTISSEAPTITTTEEPIDVCLTEDFEENFEDNFTNSQGVCVGEAVWDIQQYSSVNISSPHPKSTSFIAPPIGSSCVASYKFIMATGGTLQVNLYMQPSSQLMDQLTVTVFQSVDGGKDIPVGRVFLSATSPDFVNGWQVLNIIIDGPSTFEGYVTFEVWALSTNPVIWIDSFRYIGPSLDMDSCVIYAS